MPYKSRTKKIFFLVFLFSEEKKKSSLPLFWFGRKSELATRCMNGPLPGAFLRWWSLTDATTHGPRVQVNFIDGWLDMFTVICSSFEGTSNVYLTLRQKGNSMLRKK